MLATESAVMPLSLDEVDMEKVKKLRHHPDLIKSLDAWILSPDRGLIPRMVALAGIVNALTPQPKELQLYRGFNTNGIQETLGIKGMPHIGQVVHFESDERALSFSTDIEIAKAFGGVVVVAHFNTKKTTYLDITPELSFLVSELRNLPRPETQREVVIMPPVDFHATVVQAKKSPFSWLGW